MHRLLVFVVCAVSAGAQAQTRSQSVVGQSTDAYWNIPLTAEQQLQSALVESQTSIADPTPAQNTVVVQQNGFNNQALLQAVAGTQNRLEATQTSNGNRADAILAGSNNSVILNQTGGGNVINFGLTGNDNRYMLTQDGGDTANLQGLQKDGSRLELLQGRGNNSFTVDNTALFTDPLSTGLPNLRIEQTGGASVTIQQGRVIGN